MRKVMVSLETCGGYPGEKIAMDSHKTMPCGNLARLDTAGCYPGYRCLLCEALDGSMGQPQSCKYMREDVDNQPDS